MIGVLRRRDARVAGLERELDALRQRCDRLESQAEHDRQAVEQGRLHARAAAQASERRDEELSVALRALFDRLEQVRRQAPPGDQPPSASPM